MNTLRFVILAALAASIAACGGGTGGTGVTSAPTPAVSIGVMTKGSVIVNGVEFQDDTAQITIDNTTKTPADLQSGMVVKVRGQVNGDGVNGTAQAVKAEPEVRGTVLTHNSSTVPPTFTVVGQTVFADDLTVFAGFSTQAPTPSAAVTELQNGSSLVEVHGLRDASGNIHASRVELLTVPNALGNELRGTIKTATLTPTAFTLQNGAVGVNVSYTSSAVFPAGSALAEGEIVEVHGSFSASTFTAARVDIEDLEDVEFEHAAGENFEIEGQVSGCDVTNPCASFLVGTQAVQVNSSTRFENGAAADLADGATVEAEGHTFASSTLVAEKITFKRTRVILTGAITAASGTTPGTITVLGEIVQITSLTQINVNGGIALTTRVDVRGFVDSAGHIVAERIDNPSGGGKDSVQARVTAKNNNVLTFEIGISANLTGATQFSGPKPIADLPTFLALITAGSPNTPGTLVKVRGQFNTGTITAVEEAEIEN